MRNQDLSEDTVSVHMGISPSWRTEGLEMVIETIPAGCEVLYVVRVLGIPARALVAGDIEGRHSFSIDVLSHETRGLSTP